MRIRDALLRLVGARESICPDEGDLLAYSENKLSRRNRDEFERHFAGCDDCLELLAFLGREPAEMGTRLSDEAASEQTERVLSLIKMDERKRSHPKQQARAASGLYISYPRLATVGLAVCAIAAAGVFFFTRGQAPADAAMEALRLAVKDARYTEARVSGALDHSTYSVTRGGDRSDDDLQFSRALTKLRAAEEDAAPVDERLVLARVYLARGTREDARRALAILTKLEARGVETPESLNDTGVAQFELDNYDEAIVYFSKALAKSPGYNEALFNRALAEQRAHRKGDARSDWQQFIKQSSEDDWKNEARTHLRSLSGAEH